MAFKPTLKNVLITGQPGIGKTTCVRHIIDALRDPHNRFSSVVNVRGFYSQELRREHHSKMTRIGFDIISVIDGSSNALARTEQAMDQAMWDRYTQRKKAFRFCGKYVMDLEGFERFTLPLLRPTKHRNAKTKKQCVFIIDEIGKMELFSRRLKSSSSDC